ncbi:MAG: TatD family hydrolase, partial [Bacteroidota bacterium]
HIYSDKFQEDIDKVIEDAQILGVGHFYMPNIDHDSIEPMMELELKYPKQCFAMMGLHPCSVEKGFEKALYEVEAWLDKRQFAAVGEIGTDLYWDKSLYEYQKEAFMIQCDLAIKHSLPVAIHCRESINETIEILEDSRFDDLQGVFHCFTGDLEQANRIVARGFYLGVGGVLTFKNSGLDKVMKEVDPKNLLLETDSPYLAPTPNRGKRNSPQYLPLIGQKLADVQEVSIKHIADITTTNSFSLFKEYEL